MQLAESDPRHSKGVEQGRQDDEELAHRLLPDTEDLERKVRVNHMFDVLASVASSQLQTPQASLLRDARMHGEAAMAALSQYEAMVRQQSEQQPPSVKGVKPKPSANPLIKPWRTETSAVKPTIGELSAFVQKVAERSAITAAP